MRTALEESSLLRGPVGVPSLPLGRKDMNGRANGREGGAVPTVSSVLDNHVTLRIDCIDRFMCHGYITRLFNEAGVVGFLHHRGYKDPAPTGFNTMRERWLRDLGVTASASGLEIVSFERAESKEDRARPFQDAAKAAGTPGVVFIGKAQERMPNGFRGKRTGGSRDHPHFTWTRSSFYVDHYYFYCFDDEFGPVMVKTVPYAPFPVFIWCNGHEWLKRQLEKLAIAYKALDNGLWEVDEPEIARALAENFDAREILELFARLMSWVPSVLEAGDAEAGYDYAFSMRQVEISTTAVFDKPRNGRALFESAIRDHLDLGRPEKVRVIFGRIMTSRTPGQFSTEVITKGVDPQIQIHYKTSKAKAYFKQARALRVETTINNTKDFGVKKTLCDENFDALWLVGQGVNSRFLEALGSDAPTSLDVATLEKVVLPSLDTDGLRAPGLRFGDPRVTALLASIVVFLHLIGGLTNATLCQSMRSFLGTDYTSRQATYDLRRLRRKGFIERTEHSNTYQLTGYGRSVATFLTKLQARVLVPALSEMEAQLSPEGRAPRRMVASWNAWERQLDAFVYRAGLSPPRHLTGACAPPSLPASPSSESP